MVLYSLVQSRSLVQPRTVSYSLAQSRSLFCSRKVLYSLAVSYILILKGAKPNEDKLLVFNFNVTNFNQVRSTIFPLIPFVLGTIRVNTTHQGVYHFHCWSIVPFYQIWDFSMTWQRLERVPDRGSWSRLTWKGPRFGDPDRCPVSSWLVQSCGLICRFGLVSSRRLIQRSW